MFVLESVHCGEWSLSVLLFWPNYRLGHPENNLFSLSNKIFSGSKYLKIKLFNFEKGSTGVVVRYDVSFYDTAASTWALATPRTTWESLYTTGYSVLRFIEVTRNGLKLMTYFFVC